MIDPAVKQMLDQSAEAYANLKGLSIPIFMALRLLHWFKCSVENYDLSAIT